MHQTSTIISISSKSAEWVPVPIGTKLLNRLEGKPPQKTQVGGAVKLEMLVREALRLPPVEPTTTEVRYCGRDQELSTVTTRLEALSGR